MGQTLRAWRPPLPWWNLGSRPLERESGSSVGSSHTPQGAPWPGADTEEGPGFPRLGGGMRRGLHPGQGGPGRSCMDSCGGRPGETPASLTASDLPQKPAVAASYAWGRTPHFSESNTPAIQVPPTSGSKGSFQITQRRAGTWPPPGPAGGLCPHGFACCVRTAHRTGSLRPGTL